MAPIALRLDPLICDEYIAQSYTRMAAGAALRRRVLDCPVVHGWMARVERTNPGLLAQSAAYVDAAHAFFFDRIAAFLERPPLSDSELKLALRGMIRRSADVEDLRKRLRADARFQDEHPLVEIVTEGIAFALWGNRLTTKDGTRVSVRAHRSDTQELIASF